jgi:hypothetical protein
MIDMTDLVLTLALVFVAICLAVQIIRGRI